MAEGRQLEPMRVGKEQKFNTRLFISYLFSLSYCYFLFFPDGNKGIFSIK